jgi:hypothetical protein
MSQQVVEVYEEERDRWLETRNSVRALRVREVLAERMPVDIDSTVAAIRYPLRGHHVALVVWYPGTVARRTNWAESSGSCGSWDQLCEPRRLPCSSPQTARVGGMAALPARP